MRIARRSDATPRFVRLLFAAGLLLLVRESARGSGAPAFPGVAPKASDAKAGNVNPSTLAYYGGKVLSNVKVVQVLYGSGTYIPQLTGAVPPNMASFYAGIVNSAYMDWLIEYNTPEQAIGRGTFLGAYSITPAPEHDGSTILDSDIQLELKTNIDSNLLPAPDANTVYMIHFPEGKAISAPFTGGFLAYHWSFPHSPDNVHYAILPYGNSFAALTTNASHELIEMATDPEAGIGPYNPPGFPQAWRAAATFDEIGDHCNQMQGTIRGGDNRTYTVQKLWSNQQNACVVSGTVTVDSSLEILPPVTTMFTCSAQQFSVKTGNTVGPREAINLGISQLLLDGVTGSFDRTSITAGETAIVTLAAADRILLFGSETSTLLVTGSGSSGSHIAGSTLTLSPYDFSISVSPPSQSVDAGLPATYTVSTATSLQPRSIDLSVTGLPSGATATFTPPSVTAGQSATLTIATTSSTTPGTYPFAVQGTTCSSSHTAPGTLIVLVPRMQIIRVSRILGLPPHVARGSSVTGTVELTSAAPAGGLTVGLASSNSQVAQVPANVFVPGGATVSNPFTVTTSATVSTSTPVTITASYQGSSSSASFYVDPPPSVSVAWVRPAEVTWGPPGTLTIAGYAQNGSGGVTALWRDVTFNPNPPWNTIPYVAPPDATNVWYNTIPSSNNCHTYQVYATYSGVTSSVFTYYGSGSGYCHEAARVIWVQPQTTAGFGPPGSLIIAGSASGAPSGTGVTLFYRDVTAAGGWNQVGYVSPPDGSGIWYNSFPANFSHAYSVYITYDTVYTGSSPCTYSGNGSITWCP